MEEEKIIEVEVESSSLDEPKKSEKAQRIRDDYRGQIRFFGRASKMFFSIFTPLLFIFLALGLAFSILYSEVPDSPTRLVMMLVAWNLDGVFLVGVILAFVFRLIMRSFKKRDPNFEESVKRDDVFE